MDVLPYLVWFIVTGCLIVATPVFGILALVAGLSVAWKVGNR